jgi:hypothetical protein
MATNTIAAPFTNQLIGSFDLHKPEKLPEIFKRYGDQGLPYFIMMKTFGLGRQVSQETYSWFEENRYIETFISATNVPSPGAGNNMQITLDAASLDAFNNFYPRQWDVVMFPNEARASIVNINTSIPTAPVLTLTPSSSTDNLPAVVAGQELIIGANAFSEGSPNPKGALSGTEEFFNHPQIIKETLTATGTEMTNQSWVRIGNKADAPYYLVGGVQAEYRLAMKISDALLFERKNTNPNLIDPDTGRPLVKTEGLIPTIRDRGNTIISTPGSWSVAQFDAMVRIFDREGASSKVLSMMGLNKLQENQNVLKAYFQNTNIEMAIKQSSIGNGNNASMAATLEFQYLTTAGFTFMFSKMGSFTNPKLYGAPGYGMKNYALFIPVKKFTDPKTGEVTDNIGYRYKGWGSENRLQETWIGDSGAGPVKVTSRDVQNTYWRANIGAETKGANQMILVADR